MDAANPDYSSLNGVLFDKGQYTLIQFPGGLGGSYTIPNSVNAIGGDAFSGCNRLTSVTIPDYTSIEDYAFSSCTSLTNVTMGNGVSIGNETFSGCTGLTSLIIGNTNSFTGIGVGAFSDCTSLRSVTILGDTGILNFVFQGCTSLTNISVDAANSGYSSLNGVLFDKGQYTLIQFPGGLGGSYTIPNSVTSIGIQAFWDCTSLTSVTIGNSVTNIGEQAFNLCTSLKSVTIGNSVTTVSDAFEDCTSLTNVSIGNSVTTIESYAFSVCTSLKSVTIPNNVTSIGYEAFARCTSLTSVTIGTGVTSIGSYAFYSNPTLTGVYFLGNSPTPTNNTTVFSGNPTGDTNAIAYYLPGATGWGATFDGIPTATWTPPVVIATNSPILSASTTGFSQSGGGSFKFGFTSTPGASFTIFGSSNLTLPFNQWINLGAAVESPPGSGQFTFADPSVTNNPNYYYRVRSP